MGKTLVANLPPMTAADLARFEAEGGVWGKQRSIRRQQVTVAAATSGAITVLGTAWVKLVRRNTNLVMFGTMPLFAVCGAVIGHAAGITAYPSVASNKETTMMRRVWWAKQCAKDWDYSQVNADVWTAKHPHSTFLSK